MGDGEQRLYEPYIFLGGEWEHVGEGMLFDEPCITGGEAIERLMRDANASFYCSGDELNSLVLTIMKGWSYFRRVSKALARSRRNSKTVKRYAHGRTQRTRRNANDHELPE